MPAKTGPKGPSRLTDVVVTDIRSRRVGGASLRVIAAATGVSTDSVRRALPPVPVAGKPADSATVGGVPTAGNEDALTSQDTTKVVPVLAAPADRSGQRRHQPQRRGPDRAPGPPTHTAGHHRDRRTV